MRWVLRPLSTLALDHLAAHGEPISASPAVVSVGAAIVLLACRRTIRKCGISSAFGNWYSVRILFSQPTSLLEFSLCPCRARKARCQRGIEGASREAESWRCNRNRACGGRHHSAALIGSVNDRTRGARDPWEPCWLKLSWISVSQTFSRARSATRHRCLSLTKAANCSCSSVMVATM